MENDNWIRCLNNGNTYRYFNTYPWLHKSPLVTNTNITSTLNIGHLNVHSIPQHYNELCLLPLHQFDILCFTETCLNHSHSDQSIELMFFADPFRHDRIDINRSRGGGCAIYYKLGIDCTQLTALEDMFDDEIDSTWIKITTKTKSVIIGNIYKPPHANHARFINSLEEILLHPSTSQYDIILTGDYNINWYHNTREKNNLIQLIANLDMMQVINGTTHVGLSQESCIDLIFAPNKLSACSHGIIFNHMHNGIIWHNFTYISIKISPNRAPRKIIKQRNFKKFDPEMMLADAMNMHLNI